MLCYDLNSFDQKVIIRNKKKAVNFAIEHLFDIGESNLYVSLNASAPPTISRISVVIFAWRALL